MGRYFGTDGIRGQANNTLTLETGLKVGRYLGYYYSKEGRGKIVIGKDTRLSSSMFENALSAGISSSGCDVYLAGYCSTPCLAYLVGEGNFNCGVMISASHNPYGDNGIKIFGGNGLKIGDDVEALIEDYIDGLTSVEYQLDDKIGQVYEYKEGVRLYQDWLLKTYPTSLKGKNFIVDLANGSNCYTAKYVLNKLGCNARYLNDAPNGININNGCGSTHLEMLKEETKKGNYDMGFAFDGDADRVLFTDENGEEVDGDKIMYLLSKYFKAQGRLNGNAMVTTVMSNIGLFKSLDAKGIGYEITPVGDKNVVDCMLKNDYVVGGEQSGHIIIKHDSNFGDGLKTALAVCEALNYYGCSLREAVKEVKIYPQLLVNQRVKDKKTVLDDEEIKALIKEIGDRLGNNGRILVRPSGTEPLIRVMVEAESDEICHDEVYKVIDLIVNKGY